MSEYFDISDKDGIDYEIISCPKKPIMVDFITSYGVALSIGYKGLKTYLFNRKLDYVIVHGKVVELEKSTHKRGKKTSVTYTPIFEYYHNGQTRRARHIISSSKFNRKLEVVPGSKYQVGDEVELRVL